MSASPFPSPGTRFDALDAKATKRPVAEIDDAKLKPFDSAPDESTDTRVVRPVCRSCTKTSDVPFASPATRFDASDSKATKRPVAEIDGEKLWSFPSAP